MNTQDLRNATAAICLSVFGAAFLIVAGLWPETTLAVKVCAAIGWAAFDGAYRFVRNIGQEVDA